MVEKKPLITTVIPTYKRPVLLKRAIMSALSQTFSDLQVIVYDNCSEDETREVVQNMAKQDPRLKYYGHPSTIPAPENFRFGFSAVKTSFFSVLADDDLLLPHFYETALALLERYPSAYFFLGSTVDYSEDGRIISAAALKWRQEYFEPPSGVIQVIQKYFNWTGALFKKEILQQIHIDPSIKPIDFDFVLRLAAKFPFVISKRTCAKFTIHQASYSTKSGLKLYWPSWPKIIQNAQETLTGFPTDQSQAKTMLQQKLKRCLFRLTINLVAKKKFEEAKRTIEVYCNEFKDDKMIPFLNFYFLFFKKFHFLTGIILLALNSYRIWKHLRLRKSI